MKTSLSAFALAAILVSTTGAFAAVAARGNLAAQARLTSPQARARAVAAVPGKIASAELEREAGGSELRYTFDIVTQAGTREVGIDAKTGAVLENSADTASASHADRETKDGD